MVKVELFSNCIFSYYSIPVIKDNRGFIYWTKCEISTLCQKCKNPIQIGKPFVSVIDINDLYFCENCIDEDIKEFANKSLLIYFLEK